MQKISILVENFYIGRKISTLIENFYTGRKFLLQEQKGDRNFLLCKRNEDPKNVWKLALVLPDLLLAKSPRCQKIAKAKKSPKHLKNRQSKKSAKHLKNFKQYIYCI